MKEPIEITWETFFGDSWDCVVKFAYYGNKRVAITLDEKETGDPVMTCTVNVPDEEIDLGEVIIKDYSENAGILWKLIDAGVISEPVRKIYTGWVSCPVCKLLVNPEDYPE